jgi:hypothetical protein
VWAPDGQRLYYRQGGTLLEAALELTGTVRVLSRDSLFSGPYLENVRWPEYDVHPNGEEFVFVRLGRSSLRPVVVLNWVEELKRRAEGLEGT